MPGVIMENGSRNGVHTNHDRDPRLNSVNGTSQQMQPDRSQDKGKGKVEPQQNMTPTSPTLPNGVTGGFGDVSQHSSNGSAGISSAQDRFNDLPPEVMHITEGYIPLSRLLTRQAQKTFVGMTSIIQDLAQMSISSSATNGYNPQSTTLDDNSEENLQKKLKLLKFVESTHADWAKQLAILEWSRKAKSISRLIDLQQHLRMEKQYYNQSIDTLCEYKRGLLGATLPNPDLRTALEVLGTGKASWMPELGYIEPPLLTAKEILDQLENLNTLLSIRLNLYEHENLPYHFRDYSISSGRVTFKVAGEFEVDLAIASEDQEAQFWFIDLRFIFSPSPADMDPSLRFQIEQKVNEALFRDGLSGCYRFLHEMVLTRKILELRRQAAQLLRGRWIEGLKIEPLNRTLSIQYWVDRYVKGQKSWILLGVHSGKRPNGQFDAKATSRLSLRWFRDGKEVKDVEVAFDTNNLSAEDLLNSVIAHHVNHLLTSIRNNLRSKAVFAASSTSLTLSLSSMEPAKSILKVQLTHSVLLSIQIEPTTGRFIFFPAYPRLAEFEHSLNVKSQDPANDAHAFIESLRCTSLVDDIQRYATSVGWIRTVNPNFSQESLKPHIPKDTAQIAWFNRSGWAKDWHLAITLGMSGEKFWLMQGADLPPGQGRRIASQINIPIKSISPVPSYVFMSTLNVFATAILSNYANAKALHDHRAFHAVHNVEKPRQGIVLPSMYARLSQLLPSKNKDPRTGKAWAKDIVKITFQGLERYSPPLQLDDSSQSLAAQDPQVTRTSGPHQTPNAKPEPFQDLAVLVTEAKMVVSLPQSLTTLNEKVDQDIAFHAKTGAFAFKLRTRIGESIVPALVERASRVERLVDYVQVLQTHEPQLKCESVTLGKISFTYTIRSDADSPADNGSPRSYKATINFGTVNKIGLILGKGDPHIRVLDLLTQTVNSSEGFSGIAKLLPVTLPALRGLDEIQKKWCSLGSIGEVFVLVRAAEWYVVRYIINQPQPDSTLPPRLRKFNFELMLKHRKGDPYWHIKRVDYREREGDDLDKALKEVWDASGKCWHGMRLSGVAKPVGVEELLFKVDDVVKAVASTPTSTPAPSAPQPPAPVAPGSGGGPKPQARPPPPNQQQRAQMNQRPQGNQRSVPNMTQGRNNMHSRDIVVLD